MASGACLHQDRTHILVERRRIRRRQEAGRQRESEDESYWDRHGKALTNYNTLTLTKSQLHDAPMRRRNDGLGTVAHIQAAENNVDVPFHRALCDAQGIGDLFVA